MNNSGVAGVLYFTVVLSLALMALMVKHALVSDWTGFSAYLGLLTMDAGVALLSWRTLVFDDDESAKRLLQEYGGKH